MRSFKKMLLGAVATMVLAAGVAVSPASATVPSKGYGTEEANVPYLAWRGEHIRLGFCDEGFALTGLNVSWALEDWSGDPANGSVPVPQEMFGQRHTINGCVYTDYISQKAGVAFIKLVVSDPTTGANRFEKQFIAAWMNLTTPTVTGGGITVDAGDLSNIRGCADPVYAFNCDPAKDPRHRIKVVVKGTIPLKANFNEWGLGDQLTLPDDWPRWAAVAARSWNDFLPASWVTNWDIHDDLTTAEGHVLTGGVQCDLVSETNPAKSTDAVDNCTKGGAFGNTFGGFSTVLGFQSTAGRTIGPFDPLYPHDTLLSNGTVDAGDAPMPAAQIDAIIAENSGLAGDISGVGFLFPSFKTQVYSRDGFGFPRGHNYFAPYYYQYIPATARPTTASPPYGSPQASGIDGSGDPDGFNGFWWRASRAYQNWEFAFETSYHPGAFTKCLERQDLTTLVSTFRPLPSGTSAVAVYTDEHGEANVNFVPGLGFYFDALVKPDGNGACDLGDVKTLGTAHVTVQARYPYQPVTAPDPLGTAADFTVRNRFQKVLGDFSKGKGLDHLIRVVLAHAQNIDGTPIVGEFVCWSAQGASTLLPFPSGPGGAINAGPDGTGPLVATISQTQANNGHFIDTKSSRHCTTTDANGNTAIEVGSSERKVVDVLAQFMHEAIWRDIPVDFGGSPTGTPGFLTGGSLGQDSPGTQIPTPAQIKASVAANPVVGPVVLHGKTVKTKVIKSHKVAKALHKIRFARVHNPFHGKRTLQVRVNGKAGLVALRITIRFGGKNHVFTRHIPANRKVSIKNLPLPAKVVRVTVRLIRG